MPFFHANSSYILLLSFHSPFTTLFTTFFTKLFLGEKPSNNTITNGEQSHFPPNIFSYLLLISSPRCCCDSFSLFLFVSFSPSFSNCLCVALLYSLRSHTVVVVVLVVHIIIVSILSQIWWWLPREKPASLSLSLRTSLRTRSPGCSLFSEAQVDCSSRKKNVCLHPSLYAFLFLIHS